MAVQEGVAGRRGCADYRTWTGDMLHRVHGVVSEWIGDFSKRTLYWQVVRDDVME